MRRERMLFELGPGWALGFDAQQWMILRDRFLKVGKGWKPLKFIGGTKDVLLRDIRELEIDVTAEARAKLGALPERFLDWKAKEMPR